MTIQLNPTVSDAYDTKTLAELRQMVFDALGFMSPLKPNSYLSIRSFKNMRLEIMARLGLATALLGSASTLGAVRTQLTNELAFPPQLTADTAKTVGQIRTWLYNELGMGAMVVVPPGVIGLLNGFINEAMQTLYKRIELDEGSAGASAPTAITAVDTSQDSTTTAPLDWTPVLQLATALAKNHYGQEDAEKYFEQVEKYLGDWNARSPANIKSTLNQIINQAQQTIFARIEYDQGGNLANASTPALLNNMQPATQPAALVNDGDATVVDTTVLVQLASALAKAHYNKQDAKIYLDQFERYMHDMTERAPPNIKNIILAHIADAQRVVLNRYEVGATVDPNALTFSTGVSDNDVLVSGIFDPEPVYLLALANLKKKIGQPDADAIYAQYERYMADLEKRQPPNATSLVNRLLKQAQDLLYRRYKVFRSERWFTWTTASGIRFYGINNDDNAALSPPTGVTANAGAALPKPSISSNKIEEVIAGFADGTVLVAGGRDPTNNNRPNTADVFSESTGTFSPIGNGAVAIGGAGVSQKLADDRLLIAGGIIGNTVISAAQLYDSTTKQFSAIGNMFRGRYLASSVLLPDGRVMISGGRAVSGLGSIQITGSVEFFDPTTMKFTAFGNGITGLNTPRWGHTSTLLADGTVLIAGGYTATNVTTASCEIYDPVANTFTATGSMPVSRGNHQAIPLTNGNVLIALGVSNTINQVTTFLYDPSTATFSTSGSLSVMHGQITATAVLNNGNVIFIGGDNATQRDVELYDIGSGTFSTLASSPVAIGSQATVLPNGDIFMLTYEGVSTPSSGVIYKQASGTFVTLGSLTQGNPYYCVIAYTAEGNYVVGGIITSVSPGTTLPSAEAHATGVPANTSVVVSWTPLLDSRVTGYGIFGRAQGAELHLADVAANVTSWTDSGTIIPSGALPTVNTTGNHKRIDPREITWVGLSYGDNSWRALIKGVPPTAYSSSNVGVPQWYDIRDAIEVWPAPTSSSWLIRMKGYFQPGPFSADTDASSIDWQAIYLQAVSDAKVTFKLNGKPMFTPQEIALAQAEVKTYIGDLVAGQHTTQKYIPGQMRVRNETRPILLDNSGNPLN